MAGTKELLPGSAGTGGAQGPVLLQPCPSHPRAAPQRSLPFPALQGGTPALSSEPFSLRFPLGLAQALGAPGSQRPTRGE